MKSVSVIIPNWNGADLLKAYLPSVIVAKKKYREDVEIILLLDATSKRLGLSNNNPQIPKNLESSATRQFLEHALFISNVNDNESKKEATDVGLAQ